jgi:hypothetical protein
MAISNLKKGSILLNKGIDVSQPAEYIDDSSLRNSINFEIKRNVISKRAGETELGSVHASAPTEIMTGRLFVREGTKYNIRVGLDKIERYNTATSAWVDITGSDLTGTTTDLHDTAVPLLSSKRILCIANGIDAIRKWNASGNTADLGGTPPVAKFIQEYKSYLVCANIAGGTDVSQRVQWSDTADPENWSTGNSGSVDLIEDGQDITGLNVFGDYVAVHKRNSIYLGYLVSSTDIFQFNRKSTGSGTVANNSIVNLPSGEQIFLASDGLRVFNGISAPLIQSPINDEIRDELNPEYDYKAWGVLVKEKDEVWIGIPLTGQTTGETVYKFNYVTRILYKDTRTNATVSWLGAASASKSWDDYAAGETWDTESNRWNERSLSQDSDQVNIGHVDGSVTVVDESARSDDGSNINGYFVTKDFQSSQDVIARWKKLELWAKGGTVTVEYSIDGGDSWTEMSTSPFTLTTDYPDYTSPDIFYFDVIASKIRFRFSNDTSDESLAIKQFIIEYSNRENRR